MWFSSSHPPLLGIWRRLGFDQGRVLLVKVNGRGLLPKEVIIEIDLRIWPGREEKASKKWWSLWERTVLEEAIKSVRARGLSKDQAWGSEAIRGEEAQSICEGKRGSSWHQGAKETAKPLGSCPNHGVCEQGDPEKPDCPLVLCRELYRPGRNWTQEGISQADTA